MHDMATSSRSALTSRVEEQLLALILRANRARIYGELLRSVAVELEPALYPVLSAIGALGPVRLSEVAAAVGIDPTTASRHVAALERRGLVARAADASDGRALAVALSESGTAAIAQLRRARKTVFKQLLRDFDDREIAQLAGYLERLAAAFTATGAE